MTRRFAVMMTALVGSAAWAQAPDGGVVEQPPPTESMPDARVGQPQIGAVSVPVVTGLKNTEVFGYLKVGYYNLVGPSSADALIGSRNGFRLSTVRLGVDVKPLQDFEVVISADGALPLPSAIDPLSGNRIAALADAYVEWRPMKFAHLRAGQFKAPFDGESLLPDGALPFMWRSVMTDGIGPPDGYPRSGLTLDRQVGAMVSSDRLGGDLGVSYAVALVNGNGANQLFNDNGSVAPVGRLTLQYKDIAELGLNSYYDPVTLGTVGSLISETHLAYGADLAVKFAGVNFFALFLQQNITHPTTGLPSERAFGVMASVRYTHAPTGLEAGVRYCHFQPSNLIPALDLQELNVMVGYRAKIVPARVLVQYTHRIDGAGGSGTNDGVDGMVQVTF